MVEVCPEIEMLAAYVDHNLTLDERCHVEAHLILCRQCRKIVVMTFKTKATIEDPPVPPFSSKRTDS